MTVSVGIEDPVTTLVSLIDTNYNQGNDATTSSAGTNGGSKPTIDESWDLGKTNIKNKDLVRVYEIAGNHYPQALGKGLDRGIWRISIDISTAKSRPRLRQIYGEIVRVLRTLKNSPGTDYAYDAKFKIDLIDDTLAAKEVYIGRHYIKKKKWIPALNRFKNVLEEYETTIHVEGCPLSQV